MPRGNAPRVYISLAEIPSAIRKLTRRLNEFKEQAPGPDADFSGIARVLANKANATIEEVFGLGTQEARSFHIDRLSFWSGYKDEKVAAFNRGRDRAIALIEAAIKLLEERLADAEQDASGQTLRAIRSSTSIRRLPARRTTYTAMAITPMPLKPQ